MLCFHVSTRWYYSHLRRGSHLVKGIGGDVSTRWPGWISCQGYEALRFIIIQPKLCSSKNWCWSRSNLPVRYLFRTDQYSRIIFPLAFIVVNCVYWTTVLIWLYDFLHQQSSISEEIKQKIQYTLYQYDYFVFLPRGVYQGENCIFISLHYMYFFLTLPLLFWLGTIEVAWLSCWKQ